MKTIRAIIAYLFCPYDSTDDKDKGERSGLTTAVDHATGVHYLKSWAFGTPIVRLRADGIPYTEKDAKPFWTTEKPTVEGYYWTRIDWQDVSPEPVRVAINPDEACKFERVWIWRTGEENATEFGDFVRLFGGEWYGPVAGPQ
ncbi:hypothetical protein [Oryzomonas rubra]|uniref:Uncharacterized protein n=1 Tax=Oryzomonas rubra TaxID=2509454 RepID=A0A5A9X6Y3_9BACT|nr:hypothetical protein [Oryzomonas rubra]KAA0888720.1 hypothetical protein ET418_15175 [Oryzomonas rubra]